jgi:hypothetical protein
MRIAPNHPRLRLVALACWSVGGWWIWQSSLLAKSLLSPIAVGLSLLAGAFILATGVAYWQLSRDQRAGIIFDAKGLMLNLGNSSAFVAWENIECVGVCRWRADLLTLGSRKQFGIRVREIEPYLQSYEARLPAAVGPLASALQLLRSSLRGYEQVGATVSARHYARQRARTGYDILVPEAMLGGSAEGFAALVDTYLGDPMRRPSLGRWV